MKEKILLINIDSKIPNLALKKIEKYYLTCGAEVFWNSYLHRDIADRIYVSCIFTKNKWKCEEWKGIAEIGGTGYDIKKTLPDKIEQVKPRINWGFTTRGCIRKCPFCFVPEKEGMIHSVGDIYDIWDGKSKDITIMDNNILGLPDHFKKICKQLRKEKLRVNFNQGLDVRLVNDDIIKELKSIRHTQYYFAWDDDSDLLEKFEYIYKHLNQCSVFILVGFNTSFDDDLKKCNELKKIGHRPYIMRFETVYSDPKYIQLARWANQRHIFSKMNFCEFAKTDQGKKKNMGQLEFM